MMNQISIKLLNTSTIFVQLPLQTHSELFSNARREFTSWNSLFKEIYQKGRQKNILRMESPGNMNQITHQKSALPLWVILALCEILTHSRQEEEQMFKKIEPNIVVYKDGEQGKWVKGTFPIEISPELCSIVGHFLGDGSLGIIAHDPRYSQQNIYARKAFLDKVQKVFGTFEVNQQSYNQGHILIPKPIGDLIRAYFSIQETSSLKRRLPNKIKSFPRKHRLAALCAFIVDEGHVGDSIEICVSNCGLLEDFRELALGLGYNCSEITSRPGHNSKNPMFRFRISMKSAPKLLHDVKRLEQNHPFCNLAQKQHELEFIVRRQTSKRKKTPDGQTKANIVRLVREGIQTTNKLKTHINICGSALNEHLRHLQNEGLITCSEKIRDANVWKIKNPYLFSSV